MALQRPHISACIDGKEHSWFIVATEQATDTNKIEHRWCEKCGCLTQVGRDSEDQPIVALDDDGTPHLDTPKILLVITK